MTRVGTGENDIAVFGIVHPGRAVPGRLVGREQGRNKAQGGQIGIGRFIRFESGFGRSADIWEEINIAVAFADQQVLAAVAVEIDDKGMAVLADIDVVPLGLDGAPLNRVACASFVLHEKERAVLLADEKVLIAIAIEVAGRRGEIDGQVAELTEFQIVVIGQFESWSVHTAYIQEEDEARIAPVRGAGIEVSLGAYEQIEKPVGIDVEKGRIGARPEIEHAVDQPVALLQFELREFVVRQVPVEPDHLVVGRKSQIVGGSHEVPMAVLVEIEVKARRKVGDLDRHVVGRVGSVLPRHIGIFGIAAVLQVVHLAEVDVAQHNLQIAVIVVVEHDQRRARMAIVGGRVGEVHRTTEGGIAQDDLFGERGFQEFPPTQIVALEDQAVEPVAHFERLVAVVLDITAADAEREDVEIAVAVDVVDRRIVDRADVQLGLKTAAGREEDDVVVFAAKLVGLEYEFVVGIERAGKHLDPLNRRGEMREQVHGPVAVVVAQ